MRVVSLILLAAFAACADPAGPSGSDPAELTGEWSLVLALDEAGRPIPVDVQFTSGFDDNGNVGGRAGPNHWGGHYEAGSDGKLLVTGLVSTEIGGPDAMKGFRFLEHFADARGYLVESDDLRIRGRGRAVLFFARR